jgi:hypothetical protein
VIRATSSTTEDDLRRAVADPGVGAVAGEAEAQEDEMRGLPVMPSDLWTCSGHADFASVLVADKPLF